METKNPVLVLHHCKVHKHEYGTCTDVRRSSRWSSRLLVVDGVVLLLLVVDGIVWSNNRLLVTDVQIIQFVQLLTVHIPGDGYDEYSTIQQQQQYVSHGIRMPIPRTRTQRLTSSAEAGGPPPRDTACVSRDDSPRQLPSSLSLHNARRYNGVTERVTYAVTTYLLRIGAAYLFRETRFTSTAWLFIP